MLDAKLSDGPKKKKMNQSSLQISVHQLQDDGDVFTSNISRNWVTFLIVDININSVFGANHTRPAAKYSETYINKKDQTLTT